MNLLLLAEPIAGGGIATIAAASVAVGAAIVGLFFRGAAIAWRDERDAAVDKADRLDKTVQQQAAQIADLQLQINDLKSRNVDQVALNIERLAKHMIEEHREIVETLKTLDASQKATTTALEFLFKHVFPTSVIPVDAAGAAESLYPKEPA